MLETHLPSPRLLTTVGPNIRQSHCYYCGNSELEDSKHDERCAGRLKAVSVLGCSGIAQAANGIKREGQDWLEGDGASDAAKDRKYRAIGSTRCPAEMRHPVTSCGA